MFVQTDEKNKNINLGFGSGSLHDYACYLVALCNGLNQSGYNFTPTSLNQFLKDKELFIRSGTHNYINVNRLHIVLPDIFSSFTKLEPWTSENISDYMNDDYVVLGKVSAKGIFGTGSHFVLIIDFDGVNAIIHDPWTGEYQPVANRYGELGNILGLRIFKVHKLSSNNNPMQEKDTLEVKKSDFENLVTKSGKYDKFVELGYPDHEQVKQTIESKKTTIKKLEEDHQTYLDSLSRILWEEGEPTLSTEKDIREKIESLRSLKLKNDSLETDLEKKTEEKKNAIIEKENSFKALISKLDLTKVNFNKKIDNIHVQVSKELIKLGKLKEEYRATNGILQSIKKLLKL